MPNEREDVIVLIMHSVTQLKINDVIARQILDAIPHEQMKLQNRPQILKMIIELLPQKHRQSLFERFKSECFRIHVNCGICKQQSEQLFKVLPTKCGHQFCNTCLTEYCTMKIMSGNSDMIVCPQEHCNYIIYDEYILNSLGVEIYQKMLKFRQNKLLFINRQLKQCPDINCEEIIDCSKTNTCVCGVRLCSKCYRKEHPQSCRQSIELDKSLNLQRCPQCKTVIQKSSGCNHMTCRQCKHQFCWICRATYHFDHYHKYNILGCPSMKYSNRQPYEYPKCRRAWILFFMWPFIVLYYIIFEPIQFIDRHTTEFWLQQTLKAIWISLLLACLAGIIICGIVF